jgi:hypothetical protein
MLKTKTKKLPNPKHLVSKMFKSVLAGMAVVIFSIIIGMVGYHYYFDLAWVDSLYNASMILTGMGPVDRAPSDSGKIFASFYAIYSGVAFLTSVAVIISPLVHRFLHKFRIDVEE